MKNQSFLFCGILSSALYVAMNVFVPMLDSSYNSLSQTVSELSAIGAPTRAVWVVGGFMYSLLFLAFAWGVWKASTENNYLRITAGCLLAYAFISMFWPLAPMHLREVLATGGKSFTDTMHLTLAGATVLLMVASMGFAAVAMDKYFRRYTYLTILALLLFGLLTSLDAPKVEQNLPTPWIGVWERTNILLFLAWVVVFARNLIRARLQGSTPKQL